ncbi:hypothetical protein [Actinacidiphila glaucinigra]|nr:hypothetical protein [Actinacidiphila glaucinigra]
MTPPVDRFPTRRAENRTAVGMFLTSLLLAVATYVAVGLWEVTHTFCLDGPGCPGPDAVDLAVYGSVLGLPAVYFAGTAVVLMRRGVTAAAGVQAVFLTGWLVPASVLALRLLAS